MVMDGRWVAMPYYNVRSPAAQVSATSGLPMPAPRRARSSAISASRAPTCL